MMSQLMRFNGGKTFKHRCPLGSLVLLRNRKFCRRIFFKGRLEMQPAFPPCGWIFWWSRPENLVRVGNTTVVVVEGLPKYWPPTPSPPGECVPPAFGGAEGHTRWVERGWGINSSEDARHCSVLYICKYLVVVLLLHRWSMFGGQAWTRPLLQAGRRPWEQPTSTEVIRFFISNPFSTYQLIDGLMEWNKLLFIQCPWL